MSLHSERAEKYKNKNYVKIQKLKKDTHNFHSRERTIGLIKESRDKKISYVVIVISFIFGGSHFFVILNKSLFESKYEGKQTPCIISDSNPIDSHLQIQSIIMGLQDGDFFTW